MPRLNFTCCPLPGQVVEDSQWSWRNGESPRQYVVPGQNRLSQELRGYVSPVSPSLRSPTQPKFQVTLPESYAHEYGYPQASCFSGAVVLLCNAELLHWKFISRGPPHRPLGLARRFCNHCYKRIMTLPSPLVNFISCGVFLRY